jgi:hypothetical protein
MNRDALIVFCLVALLLLKLLVKEDEAEKDE